MIVSWIAFILSVTGIFLNAKRLIWCWPVWIVSNVLWIYHSIDIFDMPALCLWTVFLISNGYGWNEWMKAKEGKSKVQL